MRGGSGGLARAPRGTGFAPLRLAMDERLWTLQRRMNRLFESLLPEFPADEPEVWRPPVDVVETPEIVVVCVEVPGVESRSIEVSYADGVLTVTGEKPPVAKDMGKTWHRRETAHGKFRVQVPIPAAIDDRKIEAADHLGILTICLPKTAQAKAHKIPIRVK